MSCALVYKTSLGLEFNPLLFGTNQNFN